MLFRLFSPSLSSASRERADESSVPTPSMGKRGSTQPERPADTNSSNTRPRRHATVGAAGQADYLPAAAVAAVLPNPGRGNCLYYGIQGGLIAQLHPKALHDPSSMRQIVEQACANKKTGDIRLMSGAKLVELLKAKNMTLSDLGRRTTLRGQAGWGGVEEAAVLSQEFNVSMEIWQRSGRLGMSGYDAVAIARLHSQRRRPCLPAVPGARITACAWC